MLRVVPLERQPLHSDSRLWTVVEGAPRSMGGRAQGEEEQGARRRLASAGVDESLLCVSMCES